MSQSVHPSFATSQALQAFPPTLPSLGPEPLDTADPGVMLLSATPRITHMNSRARALLKLFGEIREIGINVGPECLPSVLQELCRDLLREVLARRDQQEWTNFELRRICHMVSPPLLFRGFAVSNQPGREPQMILTVQPCPFPKAVRSQG
ncbi:MAG TPA: hypothetical protein VFS39_11095 [Nitrospira sp.]|nr:hypothetical protein [Nitrospira sp.]